MTLEHFAGALSVGGHKAVLVAAAEPAVTAACAAAITRAGHPVCTIGSAYEGSEMARSRMIGLALVDADLPNDEGIILGQSLWMDHNVPFIQLVSIGDTEAVHRAIAAGAMQCLLKPLQVEQLTVAIEVTLIQNREFAKLRRAVDRRSLDFEHRNIVSMAIGMSMERFAVDENEALHMIRFAARARGELMPEFCERLIENQDEIGLKRTLGTYSKNST